MMNKAFKVERLGVEAVGVPPFCAEAGKAGDFIRRGYPDAMRF
jgi:hypothetical protein